MQTQQLLGRRTVLTRGLLLAGAAWGLAACGTTGSDRTTSSTTPSPSSTGTGAGSDLDKLRPIVESAMSDLLVPGVVVLVRTPEQTWQQAFGKRSLAADAEDITVGDHFRIGSNTKTMTGTCLLQLVDERKVALDDEVREHLPQFTSDKLRGVTIAQLLDMRSGLRSYTELKSFNATMDAEPAKAWHPEELVKIGLAEPVDFAPGRDWHYSNTNTVLAGLVVEHHDAKPLQESFRSRILDTLELADTSQPPITSAAIPDPHPRGYMYGTNVSTLTSTALSEADQQRARSGELKPGDYTDANPSWGWAAGAGISTAADLTTYVEALVGGGLLSADLQKQRLDSVKPVGSAGAGYGLALASFGPMLGHDGSLPGFTSFMGHDPKSKTTVIVLTTLQSSPDGRMVANEIARPIIGAVIPG